MRMMAVCLMAGLMLAGTVSAKEPETAKDTFSVIHSRRSVKSFTGETVSRESLDKIVRAGMDGGQQAAVVVCGGDGQEEAG